MGLRKAKSRTRANNVEMDSRAMAARCSRRQRRSLQEEGGGTSGDLRATVRSPALWCAPCPALQDLVRAGNHHAAGKYPPGTQHTAVRHSMQSS